MPDPTAPQQPRGAKYGRLRLANRRGARSAIALPLRTSLIWAVLSCVFLLLGAASAQGSTRNLQLTLQPSDAACTGWDQLDCSYIEVRDGNHPAPDPLVNPAPTFLNLANLSDGVTLYAALNDAGEIRIPERYLRLPAYPTTFENGLFGTVRTEIMIEGTDDWAGSFDEATGAMELSAPMGIALKLNCDPVSNATCGAVFGPAGNMGTWEVTTKGPVDPLTTGDLTAPTPPVAYGPDWVGPAAENGTPFNPDGLGTLINNDLEIENIATSACVDPDSLACVNPAIANLVAPSLNNMLGTVYDPAVPANDRDSEPGAIDMRLSFAIAEVQLLESGPTAITFPGSDADGTQLLGTASPALGTSPQILDAGDVTVKSLFVEGGDEDDFLITSARNCSPRIESGGSCSIKLRFMPSAVGSRTSTLYALVTNPITEEDVTIELATLRGEGGEWPDAAPAPPAASPPPAPPAPSPPPASPGHAQPGPELIERFVTVKARARVKLRTKATRVAVIAAHGGPAKLQAPRTARIRVGSKRFTVRVLAPRNISTSKRAVIWIKANRQAVRSLTGRRSVKLRVPLKIRSGDRIFKPKLQFALR